MSSDEFAIRIHDLSKSFQIYNSPSDRLKQFVIPRLQRMIGMPPKQYFREFWALKNVSFEVKRGETVGIIGRNGSGKSTLLQIICGTLTPTCGSVETNGRIAALLELGSGFNPEFTGQENVYMNATVLGLNKETIDARYDDIVAFADIGDFLEQPLKTYSSGMMVRLAFSVAIHCEPDILIIDEALSVGDVYFQAKCAKMIREVIDNGTTVLFVSHDTNSVKSLCNHAILLDSGVNIFAGKVSTAVEKYYSALVTSKTSEKEPNCSNSINSSVERIPDNKAFQSIANFQRIQNGAAEFINVIILDEGGKEIDTITFGQKVTLRQLIRINKQLPTLGFAYHIRNKNGLDIVYSDTGIESNSHIIEAIAESIYAVDWTFTAFLQEGSYTISSMASIPINLKTGDVEVVDYIPISAKFTLSKGHSLPIYGAIYWENNLNLRKISTN